MPLDYNAFLSGDRTCLVAPAGYGKTYTIVECLKQLPGRTLVLTHTHAGVASLRDKIKAAGVNPGKYGLSTIASFAQQIATAYSRPEDIPELSADGNAYYGWVGKRAEELSRKGVLRKMVSESYRGIIVDEYQDCTKEQHSLIMTLADGHPLWVLGDPMQGIFGFRGQELVDFEKDLDGFSRFSLEEPWRWKETNPALGAEIALIRKQLEEGGGFVREGLSAIEVIDCEKWDFHIKLSQCSKKLSKSGDVLIVVSSKNVRGGVAKVFGGRCAIVEAIDDEVFYRTARKIDAVQAGNALSLLNEVAQMLFTKTGVGEWLTEKGVKKKRKESDRLVSVRLSEAVEIYEKTPTPIAFFQCLKELEGLPNVSLLWHDQFHSLKSAIEIAKAKEMSVCDAMVEVRNRIRAMGRHLRPFSVGTTLVTKGLEFDHVVVVDMNPPFAKIPSDWRKHFYVAISRARKSLTIVREKAG